jgi:hypothetical protein
MSEGDMERGKGKRRVDIYARNGKRGIHVKFRKNLNLSHLLFE